MNDPLTFAALFKRLRESKGLTLYEVANHSDYDYSHIYRLAHDTRQPSRACIEDLCEAMETTPQERDDLMTAAGFATDAARQSLADRYAA